ncbi:MAG: hypothetical protein ACOYN4_09845 [Bacteroidales bacterium]
MDTTVKKYIALNLELDHAKQVINTFEKIKKTVPPYCRHRNSLQQSLDAAKQLKHDIMYDINQLADSITFKFNWETI